MDSTAESVGHFDADASTTYGGSPPRRRSASRHRTYTGWSPARSPTRSPTRSPPPSRGHKHHGRGKSSTRVHDPATSRTGGPNTSAAAGPSSFAFGGANSSVINFYFSLT